MSANRAASEWTGLRGRVGARYLNSPMRRLSEVLVLGDLKSAFLNEVSHLIRGDEAVLDIGAGSGYYSLAVAERLTSGRVICLDLSEEMLHRLEAKARKKGLRDRVRIIKGDATSNGLECEYVDLATSNGVFHELSQPEAVLAEMLRVLKPNGWVVVTDFRNTRLGKRIGAAHRQGAHGPFSPSELEALFAKAGLSNVRIRAVKHWVMGVGKK